MKKVKIFVGIQDEIDVLENQINSWIAENDVTIIEMNSNIAPQSPSMTAYSTTPLAGAGGSMMGVSPASDILIALLYEENGS